MQFGKHPDKRNTYPTKNSEKMEERTIEAINTEKKDSAVREILEEEKLQKAKKIFNEGIQFHKEGKYHGAISRYKVAMSIDPECTNDAYFNIALSYHQARKYHAAIQYYQKAIDANPENEKAYSGIGYVYKDLDNPIKANEYFQKWSDLNKKNISLPL